MRWIAVPLVGLFFVTACGPSAEEQAAAEAEAQAEREDSLIQASQAAYEPAVFDTLTWESPEARMARGAQVWNFSCSKCHGPTGLGDGGFVMAGDTLRPPSFQDPEWALAGDTTAIRKAIFVGTGEGMPHWGLEGLKAEAVDAVAHHILEGFPATSGG
jgi:mono/diheme cytochrome c family protein